MSIFRKIFLWWKFDGKYYHKDFINGVKNLWKWFPVIWKDRDWDDHYIWEILKFKLLNQADYIGTEDRHTRAKHDAKVMRLCVSLMDKIQNEFYSSEYFDYYETEWKFIPVVDMPGHSELDMIILSENFDEYIKKYPLIYKKVLSDKTLQIFDINHSDEKEHKLRIAMNIGLYNHKRARKLLFNILESNIECWWD
jgi:hypothetical protein